MSMNFTQIVDTIDRNCKTNSAQYSIADKTADINLALDFIYATIFEYGNTWQFDDSNHTDYPIITTNLIAGQRDYTFVTDEQGNLILDIYKVMVKDEGGIYREMYPVDMQSESGLLGLTDGQNIQGLPIMYDKTANGIFLEAIPSYNSTQGLKVYINREGSYFTTSDTTKKPGFAGLFHEYLALRPSYQYAYRNSLPNLQLIEKEMLQMEDKIRKHYNKRNRDEPRVLKANQNCTK